ncbi:hypothetical protein [Sphingomonas phyllosphaerae]|uniref:hypothetical protein n=1 Tax=Sphingomonas phyllosphaerae TaxID=257003 RepID=UPI002413C738|nr:hypothetical protein [Sphingomonas phyllosphaerae]
MDHQDDSDGSEWILANDAYMHLIGKNVDPITAKSSIADFLRDGYLQARAKGVWISTDTKLSEAWRSHATCSEVERDIDVPTKYWRSDLNAIPDRARWRWPYNQFFYTLSLKPRRRRMFRGVSLERKGLERLFPDIFREIQKSKVGRKHDVSARDAGWLVIVELSQEGLLDKDTYPTAESLKVEMQHRLTMPDGDTLRLGQNQVGEIARHTWRRLKPRKIIV